MPTHSKFLCRRNFRNEWKNNFDIFRTKHELKMSNEKNENLQNVSSINDSSLLLIRQNDESYLQYQFYKEEVTRCNSQLIADTYTQSSFQNDAYRSRRIKSRHPPANQRVSFEHQFENSSQHSPGLSQQEIRLIKMVRCNPQHHKRLF